MEAAVSAEHSAAARPFGLLPRFWTQPRRTFLRRAVFQVHLGMGVLLGLYTAVIGLTGSALVFRNSIDRQLSPALFAVSAPSNSRAPLDPTLHAIARRFPREPILGVDNLNQPTQPAIVYLSTGSGAEGSEQRMVYVDQANGRILGSRLRYAGFLGTCANLHYYLLLGPRGYVLNGVFACGFLLLCCTGWLLWWPGRTGVRKALRVHWHSRWKRLNWDLHAVGGFWSNPLLIAVVATGILFVFPKPVLDGMAWLSGTSRSTVTNWLSSPAAPADAVDRLTPDAAMTRASAVLQAHGSDAAVRYLAIPSHTYDVYTAIAYPSDAAEYALPTYLYLDGPTGSVLAYKDARSLPRVLRWATYAYAVHFGSFGGVSTKILWVLLGIFPAGLWATGLLLWWNRGLRLQWKQFGRLKGV